MKTFKQLRERWISSSKSSWNKQEVKIYKNPTFKELANAQYDGRGGFRAFLMSNGTMYAWGTEYHSTIRKSGKLDGFNTSTIPITGKFRSKNIVKITMSNDIKYINSGAIESDVADKIMDHKHMNKLFNDMDIDISGFYG